MPRSLLLLLLSGSVPTLSESDRQQLDALGPVALGKDGSLHRLSNWAELTAGERETAGRLIAARNEKRRTRLLEEQARAAEPEPERTQARWSLRAFGAWMARRLRRPAEEGPAIDFAPESVPQILDGRKAATTRYVGVDGEPLLSRLKVGHLANATCRTCSGRASAAPFARLRISRLERTRVDRLNGTLAATEGLGSADELRATLRRFYPHLRDADPVRVLHFALEARPGEDEQEAVALT